MKKTLISIVLASTIALAGCSIKPPDKYYDDIMKDMEYHTGIDTTGLKIECVKNDILFQGILIRNGIKEKIKAFYKHSNQTIYLSKDNCRDKDLIRHETMHHVVTNWSNYHKSEFIAECVENFWLFVSPENFKIQEDYKIK